MTLIRTFDEDDRHDEDLAVAEELWRDAGRILADLTRRARQDPEAARQLKSAVSEFQIGHKIVSQERSRVANERNKKTGAVGDYAIDFDAARAEIGRRLACLRDA